MRGNAPVLDRPSVERQTGSPAGIVEHGGQPAHAAAMATHKPAALMIGAAPPPYHGSIMMFWTLMGSPLASRFRLIHLDISDHRSLENIGRLDVENVRLALRHTLACYRLLKQERPEIVYIPIAMNPLAFLRDSMFLLLARCFRGRKRGNRSAATAGFRCILHAHGGHFHDFYHRCPGPLRAYIRWCLKNIDAAIVHSEALVPMFAGLVPPERIWPVSNGIEGVPEPMRASSRRRSGGPTVLYLGTLTGDKGFLDVMAAAPLVAEAVPGVRFVVAGPYFRPEDQARSEELLQDARLRAVVELPGAVTGDARFELMLNADVFVFPSYFEGQPTVLLEAMSAGLPVITTDEGAIRDTIVDGETGYLVPKRDPAAIARRTIELLRDEPLRTRMGAAGRRRFEERFRVESYGTSVARVFEATLEEVSRAAAAGSLPRSANP